MTKKNTGTKPFKLPSAENPVNGVNNSWRMQDLENDGLWRINVANDDIV